MEPINITFLFTALISLLLSVIAFFIRSLHSDFKKIERDIMEVKGNTQIIKAEFKSGYELLRQRLSFIENRVDLIEQLKLKRHENNKKTIIE